MAIDTDDEILQDFLVEAGEILEQLGEQLVELEQRPRDTDLLNAVFRGFHTVKGGAGFLNLTALVAICHRAEDVFNVLRQGERVADATLMDVVLRALDVVNEMVDRVRQGVEPEGADPQLLATLERLAQPSDGSEDPEPASETVAPEPAPGGDVVEAASSKDEEGSAPAVAGDNGEITEEEFEALLDQMNGGGAPAAAASAAASSPDRGTASPAPEPAAAAGSGDEISDDEFEHLLDQIHGAGQGPRVTGAASEGNQEPSKAPKAVGKPEAGAAKSRSAVAAKTADGDNAGAGRSAAKDQSVAETTVRVDTKRLDDIMNLVGELVLVRNRLATLRASMADEVAKAVANLDLVTADLQNSVMKTRMQPIKKVFGRFPRVVRDLARGLNKQVNLELRGEETDLDKNLVEALADPLVHLVRNAVDHGIESPDVRQSAGKSAAGTVTLSAEQEGDHILLSIEDDGAGMDADRLRAKAVEKGLLDEDAAARLDERAAYNLIFMPGFSTKSEISDISGRGVGMDVVKTRITQLNGTIDIDSALGRGSRIAIKVPLTLAIMPTLMVQLGDQIFALPLANVIEIFDEDSARTSTVDGKQVVIVREKAIPLVFLRNWLVIDRSGRYQAPDCGYVVVVSYGSQHVGCVVDQLIGQEEVVIKPLGSMLQGTKGLAGATITGNGRIALILDMPGLMESYGRRH